MASPLTPILVLGAFAALYAGVRWFEWSQTFRPSRRMEADPTLAGLPCENVIFYAEDGVRLNGWWIPRDDARGTILYCHGNAGNISTRLDVIAGLHSLDVNVFVFDYRGYGLSKGIPSEQGLYRDARAAYEVVRARYEDVEQPPVIIYGASLGGAVAANLACERPARGLVIEGGFTSSIDVGERWFPLLPIRAIARYRFDTRGRVSGLAIPKLFAHSSVDQVIPYDIGGELYKAAAAPKQFVPLNGEHGEAGWLDTPHFLTELRRFVEENLPVDPGP